MTAYKLSLGQQNSIKTSSTELNFKRNKALDFSSNVAVSEGQIQMPNLCNALGLMNSAACDNLVLTTQVLTNILSSFKHSLKFSLIIFNALDVCNASSDSKSK